MASSRLILKFILSAMVVIYKFSLLLDENLDQAKRGALKTNTGFESRVSGRAISNLRLWMV
jgi:hypothetical protein